MKNAAIICTIAVGICGIVYAGGIMLGVIVPVTQRSIVLEQAPIIEVNEPDVTNTFIRYQSSDSANVLVKRIQTIGTTTTIQIAVGLWTNRENLNYSPINE